MSRKDAIIAAAEKILDDKEQGLRFIALRCKIKEQHTSFPLGTITGAIRTIEKDRPDIFYKPDRGLFRLVKYREDNGEQQSEPKIATPEVARLQESDFYEPFADWLVNELEECTKAIPLGGNIFGSKWGTPDVIGVRKSKSSDVVKFPTEIVSAEIKTDSRNPIIAFGQACAYKIFSHKVYIVIPAKSQPDDIGRLDVLCRLFGIGLILFDEENKDKPNFDIRVRASKQDPDMFYTNESIKKIAYKLID